MKRMIRSGLSFFILGSFLGQAQSLDDRKAEIEKMDNIVPSREALDRKAKSTAFLNGEGIHVMDRLPCIEDSFQAKKRSKKEVVERAIALCIVAMKGEGLDQAAVESIIENYDASSYFSPNESAFIAEESPLEKDRNKFSWCYEKYWVCLWALGYVDTLNCPKGECNVEVAVSFLKKRTAQQFFDDAKLRDISEILDQADLMYRCDWAAVDARVKNKPAPGGVDSGVVEEWHYALNWLIGYMDQAWDDVSTDT